MAVSGGNLGAAPLATVDDRELHRRGRIHECLRGHRIRILGRVFKDIHLIGRRRRRLNHLPAACVIFGVEPDVAIEAERGGDLIAKVLADGLSASSPDYLADQPAVGYRVITMPRTRYPPRLFGGQCPGHSLPTRV